MVTSKEDLDDARPVEHWHACSIFADSKQKQYSSYLRAGLAAGERCLFFAHSSSSEEVVVAMSAGGFDLQPYLASGAFQILSCASSYLSGGEFDRLTMLSFWEKAVADAEKGGFTGLRVAAEMTWACAAKVDVKVLEEYEIYLNDLASASNVAFLCMYDELQFTEDALQLMVYSHPSVVTEDANVLRNPSYLKPLELRSAPTMVHLKALLATLTSFNQVAITKEKLERVISEQKRIQEVQNRLAQAQKSAEIAKAEERQYKLIAESMPQIVWIADAHGAMEYFNPFWCSLTGLPLERSLGSGWTAALHPDERERLVNEWMTFIDSGRAIDSEVRIKDAEGNYRWHICRAVPIKDEDGRVLKWLGACVDIEQQKALSAELAIARDKATESALLKSRFLANMSHEIRTPMNAVIGMCNVLLSTKLLPVQQHYANNIREGAGALLTVINDILDFSKIEAGGLTLKPVDFSLAEIIENVVELLAILARARGLHLMVSIDPALPVKLSGDPVRLRQILINLISNAIKFSNHGEIVVRASVEAVGSETVTVCVSVRDQGIGIALADQARLFRPFAQAETSPGSSPVGTGLGLSICYGLVELMKGQIGLVSEPGHGSNFWFKVPLGLRSELSLLQSSPSVLSTLKERCVLLVGESEQELAIWKEYLLAAEMKVESCNFESDRLWSGPPLEQPLDLILIDGERGFEQARQLADSIRTALASPCCKIVLMTHLDSPEVVEQAAKVGFAACVVKPLRLQAFLKSLSLVLSSDAHAAHSDDHREIEPHQDSIGQRRVLIVEDNSINRQVAKIYMNRLGFNVDFASNGKEALDVCKQQSFDLILMDCEMPVMDGFAATRAIRDSELSSGRHTPIVAMTGNALEGDRENCLDAGMDEYLTKPLDFVDLQRVVKLILL